MSELHDFTKKLTAKYSGISSRKLYGLDAFYLGNKPFIVITADDQVAVKVDDFQVKKDIKVHQVTDWKLDGKVMENWFLLPEKFNKKKNKLVPIFEMTSKVLLSPRKEKTKLKRKKKPKKAVSAETKSLKKTELKKPSLLKRIFNFK